MVRERIERVFSDGQLDECELTLHDLNRIAENFIRILNGIFHHRIEYPEPVISKKENNNVLANRKPTENHKSKPAAATSVGE
jgi:hypothetical protein